ncbi:hypothetical protein NCG89_09140 [Spongiibacter taiwanensis]|uniref:hypothetical protein n=1 Tax=Spongiibacter taiwanensis TaxID=1748242 RepID=UPI00203516DF|nr:hypothetical protein [Spongiibacter taiwanensis]USA41684.1 hypothetical protein NCG89_09140 [Spongiibacter taiwanensis]
MISRLFLVVCLLLMAGCASMTGNTPPPPPPPSPDPVNLRQAVDKVEAAAEEEEAAPTNKSTRSAPTFTMATPTARRMLLGKWYGVAKSADGGSKEWLIERLVDGTYRIDFRFNQANGVVTSQSEVGFWGVSEDIYFRIFRGWVQADGMKVADATDPDHYDAYEILALSKNYFRYRHLGLSEIYTVKKMPDHFQLPVASNVQPSAPLKFEF